MRPLPVTLEIKDRDLPPGGKLLEVLAEVAG
jgi:hypothetical protein